VAPLLQCLQRRLTALPDGLQAHIHRVKDIAEDLARCHGVDPRQAALGALAHDVARAMPDGELLRRAADLNLPIGLVERQVPVLLHGPVGAELLRREDGLECPSIYQAVYWHTTGHASLDPVGQVVFLADKLDPQKIGRYPYLPLLRQLAIEDLDRAMLEFLSRELVSLASQGQMVHPAVVEARNGLLARPDKSGPQLPRGGSP
jgi:predicted HD superfamily hydrolase involved in NAD metabolism